MAVFEIYPWWLTHEGMRQSQWEAGTQDCRARILGQSCNLHMQQLSTWLDGVKDISVGGRCAISVKLSHCAHTSTY